MIWDLFFLWVEKREMILRLFFFRQFDHPGAYFF
jgi:hypothetical protein